jgi:exosome complex RNA-binding protein Rrp42 (RNase PH superfamily)
MIVILTVKLPKVEYDLDTKEIKVDESMKTELSLKSLPIASTFIIFEGKYLLADPSTDEEDLSDCPVTISVCDSEVSFIYKPGGNYVSEEHFKTIVKEASSREKIIKTLITSAIQAGPQKI